MNKVFRETLAASELPAKLRHEFAPEATVLVTVQSTEGLSPSEDATLGQGVGHFSRFKYLRRTHFASSTEIDDHVRALREEWDDR